MTFKGSIPWNKGLKGVQVAWNRGKKCPQFSGENNPNWGGGVSNDRAHKNKVRKEYLHRLGISKEYRHEIKGLTKREHRLLYKYNKKKAGKLTIQTIQLVYEDNIKQFGTLTCYLCLLPVPFGKDHLEHKTPLSRKGTNEYNNLAIACQSCNCKKHSKTEEEYREEL